MNATNPAPQGLLLGAKTVHVAEHCVIATWLNVCVAIWHNETTLDNVKKLEETMTELSAQHRDGIGLVQYLDERSTSLSLESDARSYYTGFLRRGNRVIRYSAVVFRETGFRASAVRAILTGIAWAIRLEYPHKLYASADQAAFAMAPTLAPPRSAQKWAGLLAKVIQDARALLPVG